MILNICLLLAGSLALIYLGACVFAYFFAERMIFPAPSSSYGKNEAITLIQTPNGESIATTYFQSSSGAPLLIYSHGNGEDLGQIAYLLMEYQRRGISVLAYDYPGYGISSGAPTEAGCYDAIEAVYHYAVNELRVAPENIILYGRSVGSGPSCWLAEQHPVAGVILDGAFSSTFRVLTHVKLFPFDRFDNIARIPNIDLPLLLIHGKEDAIVPFSHAIKNAEKAGEKATTLWIENAGHNDLIEISGELYWDATLTFIKKQTLQEK